LTKSENETNKIGEREREREYLGGIDETLAPPIKATAAEVDAEDRQREKRETANR
jgi:hypothetical protein